MMENNHLESVPERVFAEAYKTMQGWRKGQTLQNMATAAAAARSTRAILVNLILTHFRHRAGIDWIIDRLSRQKQTSPELRDILRIGITQYLYMDGIAPATTTDTCVHFTKYNIGKRQSGFVNAVLRNVIRKGRESWLREIQREAPHNVRLELAPGLYQQWSRRMSGQDIAYLAEIIKQPAPVIVRRRYSANPEIFQAPDCLVPLPAPDWLPGAELWICDSPGTFFQTPAFKENQYYVQDPATLLAPAILAPKPGETIADLCAAPGGKSLLLDELADRRATIIAADKSLRRMRRLAGNIRSENRIRIAPVAGNATRIFLKPECLDAILLDVPCSNTGVIRRRPDVQWRFSRRHLQELTALQAEILHTAAALVRPGGRLVYSTCSIEPEENQQQVDRFCTANPHFKLVKFRLLEPGKTHDGAYAAQLIKEA